jgi:hypothetical protein
MTRIVAAALMGMLACFGLGAAARGQEPPVVVVATAAGDVAAGPWAMPTSGLLRMAAGTLADAPPVSGFTGLSVVHANWEFAGLLLARADLLRNERAERRQLPTFSRRIDARRTRIVAEDLADAARLARIVRDLGGTAGDPVYAFVAVAPRGASRTGVEGGPSSRGSLLSDSAPTSRFEQRVYVFRVLTPEH